MVSYGEMQSLTVYGLRMSSASIRGVDDDHKTT